ncbi:DDE-type integrase/transposase/recombinase [Paraburkholderia youngii]|uniref:DDE-type integrase/transposase/recombinase n=1 Tax=Paraburkholderia youngii TaxID=2782701 RepID=UPI003D211303
MSLTPLLVKGQWKYLYRAVDKPGKTIDFLLGVPVIFVPFTWLGAFRRDKALRSDTKIISF